MDCLNQVWFFVNLGPTTCISSWLDSGEVSKSRRIFSHQFGHQSLVLAENGSS
ncbi:hypothetical protein DPMN_106479 [Dreissena polymorpha]|uniref:Uncharacterized protein n=1 Tax=Dreissena polymorpha TaxID=45954 RepID=A0A9D4QK21_DREPO|nr:hypothetical protein DPMN_106479 [Dreissena polymorpha]